MKALGLYLITFAQPNWKLSSSAGSLLPIEECYIRRKHLTVQRRPQTRLSKMVSYKLVPLNSGSTTSGFQSSSEELPTDPQTIFFKKRNEDNHFPSQEDLAGGIFYGNFHFGDYRTSRQKPVI